MRNKTYSFLFLGPGLPRGFNNPSACSDDLLPAPFPVFFTPSAGGGIATESSVPLGAGVLPLETDPFSAGEAAVDTGTVCDEVEEAVAFASGSSLTAVATGSNLLRRAADNFNLTRSDLADFFGRALPGVDGETLIALTMVAMCGAVGWWWRKIGGSRQTAAVVPG